MYRKDNALEMCDLKLRLYVEYCKMLPVIFERYLDVEDRLNNKSLSNTSSIIRIKERNRTDKSSELLQLISEEQKLKESYLNTRTYVNSINKVLQQLSPEELDLLYFRYEKKKTLRQMGEHYNYCYMQISRILDEIIIKFM